MWVFDRTLNLYAGCDKGRMLCCQVLRVGLLNRLELAAGNWMP